MYVSDNWRGTDAGKWFLADLAESGQGFDYGLELGGLGVGEMGGEEGEGLGGGPVGAQGDLADEGGLLRKVGGPGQFFDGNGGGDGCGTWGGERGLLDRGHNALGLEVGKEGLTWDLKRLAITSFCGGDRSAGRCSRGRGGATGRVRELA